MPTPLGHMLPLESLSSLPARPAPLLSLRDFGRRQGQAAGVRAACSSGAQLLEGLQHMQRQAAALGPLAHKLASQQQTEAAGPPPTPMSAAIKRELALHAQAYEGLYSAVSEDGEVVWDPALDELEAKLGLAFRDRGLLRLALQHSSVSDRLFLHSSTKLAWVGDAVFGLAVSLKAAAEHPCSAKVAWSNAKVGIVSRQSCSRAFEALGLKRWLNCNRDIGNLIITENMAAEHFEAVIGAIYLDSGYQAARAFVARSYPVLAGEKA